MRAYAQHKAGALRRSSGKYLARQENRLTSRVNRRFKKQESYVVNDMAGLSFFSQKGVGMIETKAASEEIDALLDAMPEDEGLVEDIIAVSKPTYQTGAKKAVKELNMGRYGVSFELVNDDAVDYLENIAKIELSDFKGTINRNTKDRIRRILIEAAETGKSYNETAKLIQDQGKAGVFSRARAELIATNQVGHAYGQGNQDMVDAFVEETGSIVQKAWQTVEDDRVTPECAENEDAGWIGNTDAFPSGDEQAPRASNPRCRCTTRYRTVDTQGRPT